MPFHTEELEGGRGSPATDQSGYCQFLVGSIHCEAVRKKGEAKRLLIELDTSKISPLLVMDAPRVHRTPAEQFQNKNGARRPLFDLAVRTAGVAEAGDLISPPAPGLLISPPRPRPRRAKPVPRWGSSPSPARDLGGVG